MAEEEEEEEEVREEEEEEERKRESDVKGIICFPPMSFKSKLTNRRGPSGKLIKPELGRDHLEAGGRFSCKSADT